MQRTKQRYVALCTVPYTIGQTTREETRIIDTLNCGNTQNMYKLSSTVGQDNVVGVSSAMVMLHDTAAAVAGSTTAVHAARSNGFVVAVQRTKMPCWLIETWHALRAHPALLKPLRGRRFTRRSRICKKGFNMN